MAWEKIADLTAEEIKEYQVIDNHIGCASRTLHPSVIDVNTTQEQVNMFVMAQNHVLASYQVIMGEWWAKIKEKYAFSMTDHVHIDFEGSCLVKEVEG